MNINREEVSTGSEEEIPLPSDGSDEPVTYVMPEDGNFGEMTPEEKMAFSQLNARIQHNVNQLGLLRVRESNIMSDYHQCVAQLQDVMKSAASRLGVPPDHKFRIKNGSVVSSTITPPAPETDSEDSSQ